MCSGLMPKWCFTGIDYVCFNAVRSKDQGMWFKVCLSEHLFNLASNFSSIQITMVIFGIPIFIFLGQILPESVSVDHFVTWPLWPTTSDERGIIVHTGCFAVLPVTTNILFQLFTAPKCWCVESPTFPTSVHVTTEPQNLYLVLQITPVR